MLGPYGTAISATKPRLLAYCAGLLGACALAAPALARANYLITVARPETDSGAVSQVGAWPMSMPSLARARRVFGSPSSVSAVSPGFANAPGVADCAATWAPIGLKAVFTTLGIDPGTCNPAKMLSVATITSRRWRTWRGLRVGDRTNLILVREPRATFEGGVWQLASVYSPIGSKPGYVPTVVAVPHRGRIAAFRLNVGAQGE
jgi:hypothetical protein